MKKIVQISIILILSYSSGMSQLVKFTKESNWTNTITVPNGESWQLVSITSQETSITVYSSTNSESYTGTIGSTGGHTVGMNGSSAMGGSGSSYGGGWALGAYFVGPCFLRVSGISTAPSCFYNLVFKKISNSNSVSATSVVIPSSSTGDVDIKLEQSADNVTWTECLPGTYNSSTVKRFFRLRAVEK